MEQPDVTSPPLLPNALYRAHQVRELDRAAIEGFGIAGELLMERAGAAALAHLREHWPGARNITVVVGTGNNGGDGFVLARLAREQGLPVRVLQVGDPSGISGDAALNAARWKDGGGETAAFGDLPPDTDVIVDGVFGTGLQRDVAGAWADALRAINVHPAPVLALDIPSGLHADTGRTMGATVRAAVTVSFIGLKQGLFTADGPEFCGTVHFDALEVPAGVYAGTEPAAHRVQWRDRVAEFGRRPRNTHKGHFGHVLVVGGNHGLGGAGRLAAEAALRVGAGLVSLATRAAHVGAVLAARPEIMVHAVEDRQGLAPLLRAADVVVVGPGLGQDEWGRAMFAAVLECSRPLVVDADALNLLAMEPVRREDWVLTPHPGEAARLLGSCVAEISADRFAAVDLLQQRYAGVSVLKGAGTLVRSAGDNPVALCADGNPGMACGGMGDVLAGIIGGLLAQRWRPAAAALTGVCLHAASADRVAAGAGERGLLASDLFPVIQRLVNPR